MSLFRQALLVAITAVVVYFLPTILKTKYPVPEVHGTVAPGFEEVKNVFRENFELGWDKNEGGTAFSIYYKGNNVVDLWAGYADIESKQLWKENTLSVMFSTGKGLCALCVAILADRGLVDFKKPVAYYWLEFAQKGKESITVEQLLEHEGGLPSISETMTFELLKDYEALDRVLAASVPLWEPGTAHGYHPVSIGYLVSALVQRVDPKHRRLGKFFAEEVGEPFGIDAYIGTPRSESYRVARSIFIDSSIWDVIYALWNSDVKDFIFNAIFTSNTFIDDLVVNCGEVCEVERHNDALLREIESPAAHNVGTARGLAKLFGILANGGKLGNKTLLSQKMIEEYVNDKRELTPDLVLYNMKMRWKYGMHVIPQPNNAGNLFGASGLGGQTGYSDTTNNIGYGLISKYLSVEGLGFADTRLKRLRDSVLRAIEKLE